MSMRKILNTALVLLAMTSIASAEPFKEVTVGIPVPSITEAEEWYTTFLGADTEVIYPAPGIIEFKVAGDVWLQLFETEDQQSSGATVRFLVEDMASAQSARSEAGIDTGEAIQIPDIVTFSEFTDPFGNALGFYALP